MLYISLLPLTLSFLSAAGFAADAPVEIYAEPAGISKSLQNVTIDNLISGVPLDGVTYFNKLYHFSYPVSQDLTMVFRHEHYKTSQSGTFSVPASGYTGSHNLISWQPILTPLWKALKYATEVENLTTMKTGYCQVIATVTAKGKTLDDDPQGEAGATVDLVSDTWTGSEKPYSKLFYLDILLKKTFPFPGLEKTSKDGGVIFINVEPGHKYKIITAKAGVKFTTPAFTCRPELWDQLGLNETVLINLSPPRGPTVIN